MHVVQYVARRYCSVNTSCHCLSVVVVNYCHQDESQRTCLQLMSIGKFPCTYLVRTEKGKNINSENTVGSFTSALHLGSLCLGMI